MPEAGRSLNKKTGQNLAGETNFVMKFESHNKNRSDNKQMSRKSEESVVATIALDTSQGFEGRK